MLDERPRQEAPVRPASTAPFGPLDSSDRQYDVLTELIYTAVVLLARMFRR